VILKKGAPTVGRKRVGTYRGHVWNKLTALVERQTGDRFFNFPQRFHASKLADTVSLSKPADTLVVVGHSFLNAGGTNAIIDGVKHLTPWNLLITNRTSLTHIFIQNKLLKNEILFPDEGFSSVAYYQF